MAYSRDELLKLGAKDLNQARSKIASLNIFDNIVDLKLDDRTLNSIRYTLELYQEYLENLKAFSNYYREKELKNLKNTEVIDNHSLENENPDLLHIYSARHHSTAINYFIRKLITEGQPLNASIIKKAHEILMRGTSNMEDITMGYRKNNNFFVGYQENGENVVLHYPISYNEIAKALTLFLDYYNTNPTKEEDLFVKPFLCHGILAALQLFEDGNTRLSRTIQHVNLFQNTKELIDNTLDLPAIYFSKTYIPYYKQYRDLISTIAVNPTEEEWNTWIKFNLNRLQDQLYQNDEVFERMRRK